MKLIIFPLIFLVVFAFLSALGISNVGFATTYSTQAAGGIYDSGGHQVAYANGTAFGEAGTLGTISTSGGQGPWNVALMWRNESGVYSTYDSTGGVMTEQNDMTFDISSSIGLIALISVIMGLGVAAGINIFGSGLSDTSVKLIVLGTVLIGVWGVFSVLALPLITSIPIIGAIFYFFLTVLYTTGVAQQVGGGGED